MGFKKHNCPPSPGDLGPRIMCLSRLLHQTFNKVAAEEGLFYGQQNILFTLVENEGITLSELAKKLEISTATASVSVKRMEKSGFITKKQDANNARIIRLYPTQKAKDTPEKIKIKMDSMDAVLKNNMTEEQVLQLSDLLDTAISNIIERGENDA